MTQARVLKLKVRRVNANCRERSRMHGLNDALDELRSRVPCGGVANGCLDNGEPTSQGTMNSTSHKLSKIDTLRLAHNYIAALSESLRTNRSSDHPMFLRTLCEGLSQSTANMVSGSLNSNHVTPDLQRREQYHQHHHLQHQNADSPSPMDQSPSPPSSQSGNQQQSPPPSHYYPTSPQTVHDLTAAGLAYSQSGPMYNSTPVASPGEVNTPLPLTAGNDNLTMYGLHQTAIGQYGVNASMHAPQLQQHTPHHTPQRTPQSHHASSFNDSGVHMNCSPLAEDYATHMTSSSPTMNMTSSPSSMSQDSAHNYQLQQQQQPQHPYQFYNEPAYTYY